MPRYYFDIHDGVEITDDEGLDLLDLDAARTHALGLARAFTTKPGMLADSGGAVVVSVRDATGAPALDVKLVFTITNG